MTKRRKFAPAISGRIQTLGWLWFAFQLACLPGLLTEWTAPWMLSEALVNFIYYGLNFFAVVSIFREYLIAGFRYAAKHMTPFLRAVAVGFLGYYLLNTGLIQAVQQLRPGFFNINDHSIALMFLQNPVLMTVGTVLLVPVAEECLFRGLIFSKLYPHNKPGAYALSAAAFCAIHVVGYIGSYSPAMIALCAVQYLIPGLALAWSYAHSGTIAAPILLHTAINLMAVAGL